MNIIYSVLDQHDFNNNLLCKFNRYQETKKVIKLNNGDLKIENDFFIDDWDDEKKTHVINGLRESVLNDGIVIGAFTEGSLIGFSCIEGKLFGKNKEYLELNYIHVSNEYRGNGIGKKLFSLGVKQAKNKGATKLYIGAHPAIESQSFYKSLGCNLAKEINMDIYKREPLDIQLEYQIKK